MRLIFRANSALGVIKEMSINGDLDM